MAVGPGFNEVLIAAQLGAEWAWRAIYRDLAPAVMGYLRLHGVVEPEDLTADVFLQLVRGLPRFSGDEAQFRSWVFLIARHRIVDARRTRFRRLAEPAEAETILRHGPVGNCEDEALDRLVVDEVRQTLDRLSDAQREVLLLRIVAGLTLEETARIVGRRVGSVKALQRRGVAAVRRKGLYSFAEAAPDLAADIA